MMMHLEFSIAPEWNRITEAREALILCARATGAAGDCAYAVGLVGSELLENAVKYGCFDGPESVQLVVHMDRNVARIVVTNRIDADSHHADRLRAALLRLTSAPSVLDAYIARVQELIDPAPDSHVGVTLESGLGILRVAHEADSEVTLRFLENSYVEVTASMAWMTEHAPERSA